MKQRRYVVTYAQNNSKVHAGFFAALKTYCKHNSAELIVVAGKYRNPTSPKEREKGLHWADELAPYLTTKRRQLCPNLCLYADIPVQPTASNPLGGFNVLVGKNSGIIAHPKRALASIPTSTRLPRFLATTSAITVQNYSASRAGKTGDAHHVIGALLVEIDSKGRYWMRQISAEKDGSFYELDKYYAPKAVKKAPPILSLTLGDIHVGQDDEAVLAASEELAKLLKPQHLVLHDVLDFRVRNHHDTGMRAKYAKRDQLVRDEVDAAAEALTRFSAWAKTVHVVRSNHDEAIEKWLNDTKPFDDPTNAPYFHQVWARCYECYAETGQWPDVFAMECDLRDVPENVKFMARDESLVLGEVEHGFHGDKGVNGSRGSTAQYAKLGCKSTKAHDHTAAIVDGCFGVGVTGKLEMSYNLKPGTWSNTMCVQYVNGKRTLVTIIEGSFTLAAKKGTLRAKR